MSPGAHDSRDIATDSAARANTLVLWLLNEERAAYAEYLTNYRGLKHRFGPTQRKRQEER